MSPSKYASPPLQIHKLDDFTTAAGAVIPDAFIAYKTWGSPTNPVIVYPTWYSGAIADNEWLIQQGLRALDVDKFFIIVVAMFGNSESSSPSNFEHGKAFPSTTMFDNVKAQHHLVQSLGIKELYCVLGWSMGAGQSFQWAVSYPDMVKRIVPFCGAARTAHHNITFLRSLKMALALDPEFKGGDYTPNDKQLEGKKAFAAIYSIMGFSQAFYRAELFKSEFGYGSLEEFLQGFWDPVFAHKDANDLRHLLDTWINADITNTPGRAFTNPDLTLRSSDKSYKAALGSIKAHALVMPGGTDLYFPQEDSSFEVEHIPHGKLDVIPSIWGHFAGFPTHNKADLKYLDDAIFNFFQETTK